ncbi:unnamed protein product [Rotaria sordida]|uniref:Uncharacterized protein n=1 Tax=Rotaria sordida TaxID=392033 RepID=A0A815WK83_9BILA|nr:unnamed protein product [Rotaria sordida]CAF1266200.1 unnamed protein product [Rotaria sordida]CAF1545822.1 unnamed protein product [Rotaria sordida]CAF1545859.1 unnamed protein product [Rotaria sordida]
MKYGRQLRPSPVSPSIRQEVNVQLDTIKTIPSETKSPGSSLQCMTALKIFAITFFGTATAVAIAMGLSVIFQNSSSTIAATRETTTTIVGITSTAATTTIMTSRYSFE